MLKFYLPLSIFLLEFVSQFVYPNAMQEKNPGEVSFSKD